MRSTTMRLLLAALMASLVLVPTALASASTGSKTLCERAYGVRQVVVHKHGKRAPGRNICRFGVKTKKGTRNATVKEKYQYLSNLKVLVTPAPAYLAKAASLPTRPPAGTLSASYAPTGVAACIVTRESHGDPGAKNGQYEGIAQWSPEAWARMGGTQYASHPTAATKQDQLRVLSSGLSKYGAGDWRPYDGC